MRCRSRAATVREGGERGERGTGSGLAAGVGVTAVAAPAAGCRLQSNRRVEQQQEG